LSLSNVFDDACVDFNAVYCHFDITPVHVLVCMWEGSGFGLTTHIAITMYVLHFHIDCCLPFMLSSCITLKTMPFHVIVVL